MTYLTGIWVCFLAFATSGLYRLMVVRRLRTELVSQEGKSFGQTINEEKVSSNLLKQHKSRIPVSKTRSLANALIVIQLLATGAGVVLSIVAQMQPHSLFHLISTAR